jgi:hypothetical protein
MRDFMSHWQKLSQAFCQLVKVEPAFIEVFFNFIEIITLIWFHFQSFQLCKSEGNLKKQGELQYKNIQQKNQLANDTYPITYIYHKVHVYTPLIIALDIRVCKNGTLQIHLSHFTDDFGRKIVLFIYRHAK